MIIFSAIYLLFLCAYFITRTGNNIKIRAINKYILASMYLIYSIVMFYTRDLSSYYYVLMAALFFACLGDIFLVFDFKKGGNFFLTCNICFSIFYLLLLHNNSIPFVNYFWVFIVWGILIGGFVYLSNKYPQIIKLEKMKKPMIIYLSSITLHGLLGLASAIVINTTPILLMGIGSLLFMVSDYILTTDRFIVRKNKWIVRSNSLTYFVGMLLIVLSMGL